MVVVWEGGGAALQILLAIHEQSAETTGKDNMLTALQEAYLREIQLIHVLKHAKTE